MYKKRTGTAGIRGQLYETKLSSLLLFRAQHNDIIEDFYLGTNVEGNGAFDDICLRATVKGYSRNIAIFIQAKHTENDDRVLTLKNRNDLAKYFESFMAIKQRFSTNSTDEFFKLNYHDTNCMFIIYTTKQGDFQNIYNSSCSDILNDLISTRDLGSQPLYTKEDIDYLYKISLKEEIKRLATRFVAFIYNKTNDMNDDLILRYHVLLAKKVINVSDVVSGARRTAKFRMDFFSSKDDELLLIKDKLIEEVLSKRGTMQLDESYIKFMENYEDMPINDLLQSFFSAPEEYTLSQLILNNIVTCKHGQLKFVKTMPINLIRQLEKVNMPTSELNNGLLSGVKLILKYFEFEVPAVFGNKDLAVKGNPKKVENRLNYLVDQICKLLEAPLTNNIVVINEMDPNVNIFRVNGGLDSAVGNALVLDKKTNMLQFNEKLPHLGKHCQVLLEKLESRISNLQEYRFDVKIKNFPKLSFECDDKSLATDFFKNLIFYTNQEDESGVGQLLKQEIEAHEGNDVKHFRVKSDAIFHNFHVEIQNWWLTKKEAKYLRKDCNFYQHAKNSIINDPITTVISMMYLREIRNIQCTFKDNPTKPLQSVNLRFSNIIVTDITKLTFIKLTQNLKDNKFIVLDLKYMQHLQTSELKALATELSNVNKETNIFIVCDKILHRNLLLITRALQDKNVTVIANKIHTEMIMTHFPNGKITNDEGNSLSDLSKQSQNNLVKTARALFQGQEVSLDLLIDDTSVAFIKGTVLNKILFNETITISEALELPIRPIELLNYDIKELKYKINDLYIDRRVKKGQLSDETECKGEVLRTLFDINDNIVLITAKPGMGKSTLLSYLSIKTKQKDKHKWVIRINLLDYSRQFNMWQESKTVIGTLEMLTFMCQIIVKSKLRTCHKTKVLLADTNGDVHVNDSIDDEWIKFELDLFLHYFKNKNLILLFDGFDEICPNYENEVVSFIKFIRSYNNKHKIWITSRPYNNVKHLLQQNFDVLEPYELIPLADKEQEIYFEKFWQYNLVLHKLNNAQLQNIKDFLRYMKETHTNTFASNFTRNNKPQNFLLHKVYFLFIVYLQKEVQVLPMAFPLDDGYRHLLNVTAGLGKHSQERFRLSIGTKGIKEMFEFVGTPLHMYLVADYFLSAIKDDSEKAKEWDLDVNTYAIYENFLVSKLKKIRFEDKNKMDIYNPDVIETYETVHKDFINIHKKLAAYAIFHVNGLDIFVKNDLKEIKSTIKKIENGGEKAGLIYNISNNIPQFIHMTFTEYFAVEYVSDILINNKDINKQEAICHFIINIMFFESSINVLNIIDMKLKMDLRFASAIEKNKMCIFKILISQNVDVRTDNENVNTIKSSLNEAITKNLNNFLSIFMSTLEDNTNENNLDDYIKCVINSGLLRLAAVNDYDDIIVRIFKFIKQLNVSKWRDIVRDPRCYCDDITLNFRIHRLLRHHFLGYYQWSHLCEYGSFVINNEAA